MKIIHKEKDIFLTFEKTKISVVDMFLISKSKTVDKLVKALEVTTLEDTAVLLTAFGKAAKLAAEKEEINKVITIKTFTDE